MEKKVSELSVIIKAKDLHNYVLQITEKSPKQYRSTYMSRMQDLCMGIIEDIYLAYKDYVSTIDEREQFQQRWDYLHSALTKIKLLVYFT